MILTIDIGNSNIVLGGVEGDEIVFVFTRGYMDANDDYQEGPYDPSTNEYKDPEAETAA